MLIAILVIGGVALLTRKAKAINSMPAIAGQFSTTGMAPTVTAKATVAVRGIPTFTPSEQTPSVVLSLPHASVGVQRADPSIQTLRTTYGNVGMSAGIVDMLSQQRMLDGGYK